MSSDEMALRVTGLHKSYRLGLADTHLREAVMRRMRHPLRGRRVDRFAAVDGVTFDVPAGQVLGIIGRNGAGKSTLLKIISRITQPDQGSVEIWGRIGSLLEVGTGFHPELTGRENVFLNGSILGMRKKEIASKYDTIVDFAGIEQFMDTPVKRYSSGMMVRLAFSVAAHLDSEIVILDEVLAVGDTEFQAKCVNKIESLTLHEGRTALFVSHNMVPIRRVCQRVIVLDHGRIVFDGDTEEGLSLYLGGNTPSLGSIGDQHVVVTDGAGDPTGRVSVGSTLQIHVRSLGQHLPRGPVVITVLSDLGVPVAQFVSDDGLLAGDAALGMPETIALSIPNVDLPPGAHQIIVALRTESGRLTEIGSAVPLEVVHAGNIGGDSPAPYFWLPGAASRSAADPSPPTGSGR